MNPVRFHSQDISAMKKALFVPNNKYAEFRTTTPKGSVVQYVNLGGGKAKKQILKSNGTIIISELSATNNPHKIGSALNVRELYPESIITTTFKEDGSRKILAVGFDKGLASYDSGLDLVKINSNPVESPQGKEIFRNMLKLFRSFVKK